MKQMTLFSDDDDAAARDKAEEKYSTNVQGLLIYEPSAKCPNILTLVDTSKVNRLINEIKNSTATDEEKKFLIEAAHRHAAFNYSLVADYYAHASKEVQRLFEHSALVIVDFNTAVEYGYVQLSDDLYKTYLTEDYTKKLDDET